MKKKKDWFKVRGYQHIGISLLYKDRKWVYGYVRNIDKIAEHAFLPLIYKPFKTERCKRNFENPSKKRIREPKIRPICYANHLDASIYSYYAFILVKKYDDYVKSKPFNKSITAYRQLEVDDAGKIRNKCNIDFAKDVFEYIKENCTANGLAVLTFDVEKFFDNLDPIILKKCWIRVLGSDKCLSKDHYAVYKNVVRYSYVHENELFNLFKNEIPCSKKDGTLVKRKIIHSRYMHNHNAMGYCDKTGIKKIRESGIIVEHRNDSSIDEKLRTRGIPQGLPISSVLANIYMLDFDSAIYEKVNLENGFYNRYCDDVIVVCPIDKADSIKNYILERIKDLKLNIQEKKTNVYYFKHQANGSLYCEHAVLGKRKALEFLGFQFDGQHILLKSSSVSSFYCKLMRSVHRGGFYAININTKEKYKLFTRKLYKRFTRFGMKRSLRYKRDPNDTSKFVRSTKYNWGNYLSYAHNASRIMKDEGIKNQLRHSNSILVKIIKRKISVINKVMYARSLKDQQYN